MRCSGISSAVSASESKTENCQQIKNHGDSTLTHVNSIIINDKRFILQIKFFDKIASVCYNYAIFVLLFCCYFVA